DYNTPGATGYFGYFGAVAGDPALGWYAYTRGTWRIIVLNSNCSDVGGCDAGSPQDLWLRDELAAHADMNVLAYWHHPRFSSGVHGNDPRTDAFWQRLYDAGADLILNGHDHDYERFASLDPTGGLDATYGIREFVVGTGGRGLAAPAVLQPNSQLFDATSLGILELTLNPDSYAWRFVPVAGKIFTDAGQAQVHGPPPPDGTAPSAPTNLTAPSITANAVELAWDAASDNVGVVAYEVLRGGQPIGQSSTTRFVDPNVLPGQMYEYAVRARDAAGNWSPASATLWVSTPAPPSTISVQIGDDATIRPDRPSRNYGTAVTIEVDASSEKDAMLQLSVPDLAGQTITSATLYLYCVDSSDSGGELYSTATGWSESTVTWASAPLPIGGPVGYVGPVTSGSWYSVDLSSVITAAGTYSFRVKSSSANGADYTSSEGAAGFQPVLVLELAP
ncbi:MAG TPA: DNRLRE domain-containing protein, partial [Candidatus Limnocylindrales bacterium]|nr:DNRLRE domain-containing protein [Candidatus Limnocylindrales bacterium]